MPQRKVNCHHCGWEMLVSSKAFSVGCPKCNQRICIEDFTLSDFHGRTLIETSGSIAVTETGFVQARIKAKNLDVAGFLQGNAVADDKVTLGAGSRLDGNITAKRLEVSQGASIRGFMKIGS